MTIKGNELTMNDVMIALITLVIGTIIIIVSMTSKDLAFLLLIGFPIGIVGPFRFIFKYLAQPITPNDITDKESVS